MEGFWGPLQASPPSFPHIFIRLFQSSSQNKDLKNRLTSNEGLQKSSTNVSQLESRIQDLQDKLLAEERQASTLRSNGLKYLASRPADVEASSALQIRLLSLGGPVRDFPALWLRLFF